MPEPVVSVADMRAREALTWSAGVSQESVIRRAGAAVAAIAHRLTQESAPVLVLAGPGHNGSDAVVAEDHLVDRDTTLLRLQDPASFAQAAEWFQCWSGNPRALVIDGIFGIGLNRALEGPWRELIEAINRSGVRVLSVDVPSGLNADTGEVWGSAVRATVTVTLGAVKRGLLNASAAEFVGRLELVGAIGLLPPSRPPEAEGELEWILPEDFWARSRPRRDDAHKGSFGHVAVIAGSLGYHGAAVLAAGGALRARPGLVTVFTQESCYVPVASQLAAAMVRPWSGEPLDLEAYTAWVVGPGLASPSLSPAVRTEIVRIWRESPGAVVADASAIDWLPHEVTARAGPRLLTPHPGEAARRLGLQSAADVQADRVGALRKLAGVAGSAAGVGVVLKGRHTLIGGVGGRIGVNSSGNPGMAQGGTGDVLAGYLGGLLASPGADGEWVERVRYGVWRHGRVADQLEETGRGWTAEDLVRGLAGAP